MKSSIYLCAALVTALTGCAGANGGAGPDWDAAARNFQNYQNGRPAAPQFQPMQRQTFCNSYRTGSGVQTICQ